MASLDQQYAIGQDEAFRRRVRSAIIARAITAATATVPVQVLLRKLAMNILDRPDEWATRVARGLATKTAGVTQITRADQITDDQIVQFVDAVLAAYVDAPT